MSVENAANAAYLIAALLFILSLAGLSKHETAPRGLTFGIAGMTLALVATIALALSGEPATVGIVMLVVAMLIGAGVGLARARSVQMTEMPELIALLHSFVGLAAVLVGWNGYLAPELHEELEGALLGIHYAEVFIGVFIGAVTFTGSIVAYLKLSAKMKSAPLVLPGKNLINAGIIVAFVVLTVWFVISPNLWMLIVVTVLADRKSVV